jgi:ABC-type sugar transport system ATPase subunit
MLDIRLETLRKAFAGGKVVAVNDLTMTFPAGTTTCLLGPSGCGKTTLMRMIAGLESPSSGEIYFGDERITHLSTRQRNIGMVFQYPVVYRGISVRENIELPLREEGLAKTERERRVKEVADLLEMGDSLNKEVGQLDNGTRQKVAVARAVARQPRIILFDEPITNVDINAKLQLKRALKELFTRLNQTIIYVTHDQTEAMTLADRIALMQDGRIIQYAPPREIYNQPDDVFGGWFMGNPGMNFFEGLFKQAQAGAYRLPFFAQPLQLHGATVNAAQLTLGIRPEHVRVSAAQSGNAVAAQVVDRAIVIGGQTLLQLKVGDRICKAKLPARQGNGLGDEVWVEFPLDRVRLFGADGHHPDVALAVV